jgi:hypothetical protein
MVLFFSGSPSCPQEESNLRAGLRKPALYPSELWGKGAGHVENVAGNLGAT